MATMVAPAPVQRTIVTHADTTGIELTSTHDSNEAINDTYIHEAEHDDEEAPLRPTSQREQALVLAGAFMAVFATAGLNQSYGVFQEYYTSDQQTIIPRSEASNTALIAFVGTLSAGLTWGGGAAVQPLATHIGARAAVLLGAVLMALGLALASVSRTSWQLLLTQGLIWGIGSALVYFPPVGAAPEFFGARRGAAMGLVLSGAGLGALALAPLSRALLEKVGVRWALRALALLELALGAMAGALSPGPRAGRARPGRVAGHIARSPVFIAAIAGAFLQSGGYLVPLTLFSSFSSAVGVGPSLSALLLGVSNAVSAASRLLMGAAADSVGRQNTLIVCCVGSALCVLAIWSVAAGGGADARGAWLGFVVLYGALSGGYAALLPTTVSDVFGVHAYPSINGLLYLVRGCGVLFGSPVGGLLVNGSGPSGFKRVVWYDGALLAACSVCVLSARGLQARERGVWKWKA